LTIVGGLIATAWQARVAARERDQARAEKAKAEQLNKFLQSILSAASPEEKGRDAKVIEVLQEAAQRIHTELAGQPALEAQALETIGVTYNELGLVDEAEASLHEALQLNSTLYGADSEAAAGCMIELSLQFLNKNRPDEAEPLLQKGIAIERKVAPAGNRNLAYGLFILGELYVRRGEYEKAKPLLQEALTFFDRLAGPNNEDSAFVLVSLGRAQQFSGDLNSAEATYRKSVAIYQQLPARYGVRRGMALLNLSSLLTTKGDFDEGVKTLREADTIFAGVGESYYLFESKAYLCFAFFNRDDYAQAIVEGSKAIEIARKLNLTTAADFITVLRYVGLSLTRNRRAQEAEPLLREALERATKATPKGATVSALTEGALGECLTAQNKFAAAEPFVLHSYETLKASAGEKQPAAATALKRVVDLYEKWRKPDLAAKYRAMQ
jgi:tetratricopeptide (TPR) repeat protein